MYPFKTIDEADLKGKKIILRAPFDIELDANNQLKSTARIDAVIPTLNKLLENQCSILIITHVGRPKGKQVENLTTHPHAQYLSNALKTAVEYMPFELTQKLIEGASKTPPGMIVMLENIRFFPGEEAADPYLAKKLSKLGDMCVFEAFPQAHRQSASTTELVKSIETVAGYYFMAEYDVLSSLRNSPNHPFTCIFGGAKVKDKVPAIKGLINPADNILLGGITAQVFAKSQGYNIGQSTLGDTTAETFALAQSLYKNYSTKIILPQDLLVMANANYTVKALSEIGPADIIVDIGPKTQSVYADLILKSQQILLSGNLGVCTNNEDSRGTKIIGETVSQNEKAKVIVMGGDTNAALEKLVPNIKIDHKILSGGAALEFLTSGTLPVLEAMNKWKK